MSRNHKKNIDKTEVEQLKERILQLEWANKLLQEKLKSKKTS